MQTPATSTSSVTEKANALLSRIKETDASLHAYVACDPAAVRRDAAILDALDPTARGPLHGCTVAVKDLIDVAGLPTRAGSSFFHRDAQSDAPVIARLRAAGALIVGKTNTHEFAWGITTENPHTGRTCNPWDLRRIPGGSSGGSGAAVAAGLCDLAIGTDTLGSVRVPAACCGISGLRTPTGIIPTDDIVPLAPELDTVGPLAYDVTLLQIAYAIMAGAAPSSATPPTRIARLRGAGVHNVELALERALDEACATLQHAGTEIIDINWWDAHLTDAAAIVQQHAAARVHAGMIAEHREDYGADVRERVERALGVTDAQLADARTIVAQARTNFARATNGIEGVIMPIVPGEAPISPAPPSFRAAVIPLATPASAFGLPSLAIPIGFGKNNCPLSMQILSTSPPPATILALGKHFQELTNWHKHRPWKA